MDFSGSTIRGKLSTHLFLMRRSRTSALFHSTGLIFPLTPPAIHINSFACVPVDRRNERSLQRALLNTCQCFTSLHSLHNSYLQNQSETGDREERRQLPYLCVCINKLLASRHAHLGKSPEASAAEGGATWPSQVKKDVKNAA